MRWRTIRGAGPSFRNADRRRGSSRIRSYALVMPTPYDGEVQVENDREQIYVVAKIGDLDDPGWLGQITRDDAMPLPFDPGTVAVRLLEGDRKDSRAQAYIDAGGALRGSSAFTA